ncbi:MAG: hypothetical protein HDR03_03485 [Lachnospiraceae bacterium]|nr:hypothetical protein [Lachnospiraceae bacterium]
MKKCVIAMFLLNVLAWIIFLMMDAIAEFLLNKSYFPDLGCFSIPCILTVLYMILERKLFATVRFNAKYNLCMAASFIMFASLFGAIVWLAVINDIWLIPQYERGPLFDLNGVEYLFFPIAFGIVSLILGFVIKLISYILYRRKQPYSLW